MQAYSIARSTKMSTPMYGHFEPLQPRWIVVLSNMKTVFLAQPIAAQMARVPFAHRVVALTLNMAARQTSLIAVSP